LVSYGWTMKTHPVLALTAASILLTGSAAFAVNSQVLNGSPSGSTAPANSAIPTQSETDGGPASPVSKPRLAATEDAGPGSSSAPAALVGAEPNRGPASPAAPPPAEERTAAPLAAPGPKPSRSTEPADDHGGRGEQEPGDDKRSGNDDGGSHDNGRSHGGQELGDDKQSGSDD
jgi:hypothetical protein